MRKGAMLYVNAGKGHYIPAKALAESFERAGYESILEDLFVVFDSEFWEDFCRSEWRFMLRHPRLEAFFDRLSDTRLNGFLISRIGLRKKHLASFRKWLDENNPDFIISTNFIGGVILPYAVRALGLSIPVFQYCPDVFDTPRSGVCNLLTKVYIASEFGRQVAISKGQHADTVSVCPFPLRSEVEGHADTPKEEARKALGLPDRFTILCAFGGEGIGSTALLYELAKRGLDCQAVVIGGKSEATERSIAEFSSAYPDFPVYNRGFVDNVQEYLAACDIQVGKTGANSMMEAMYMRRPFIISEVMYLSHTTLSFLKDHRVGWGENNPAKQADIIEAFCHSQELREKVQLSFHDLPIRFGADAFRDQIIGDMRIYPNGEDSISAKLRDESSGTFMNFCSNHVPFSERYRRMIQPVQQASDLPLFMP